MKKIVTTELGLHPLTLQDFDFMQKAYLEGFSELIKSIIGGAYPCILQGMDLSINTIGLHPFTMTTYTISKGLFFDGQDMIILPQDSTVFVSSPFINNNTLYIDSFVNNSVLPPVAYKNGQLKYVYTQKYATVSTIQSSSLSVDYFRLSRLQDILASRIGYNPESFEPLVSNWNQKVMASISNTNVTQFSLINGWTWGNNFIPNASYMTWGKEVKLCGDVKEISNNSSPNIWRVPDALIPRGGGSRIFLAPCSNNFNASTSTPPANKGTIMLMVYKTNNIWYLAVESLSYYRSIGSPSIILDSISWLTN